MNIDFTISESCTPNDLTITLHLDAEQNGVLDGEITNLLSGTYPNYHLSGTFPLGAHYINVKVVDGCGNKAGLQIPFEVIDCKAPAPICINGLAVELMPVIPEIDVDGDGSEDMGAMTIWASDFIASPAEDCTGSVTYSINRVGMHNGQDQTGLTLTCTDNPTTLVEIWAYDEAGNADYCETYVLIQDNMVHCDVIGQGAIAGAVLTEELLTVEGVAVELSGGQSQAMSTEADGAYSFDNIQQGYDYTIIPSLDQGHLNGVSTFDLVLMTKHILGLQSLDSPYKMIAADVNRDNRITAQDALALRATVLHINTEFPNNTSWRFIPADYIFPNPEDPWLEEFPEVININDLQGILSNNNFIATKVGDIDLSASANERMTIPRSAKGIFSLQVSDVLMQVGEEYQVDVSAADLVQLQGFQGTLSFDRSRVELIDIEYGLAKAAHFGLQFAADGIITTSWNREDVYWNKLQYGPLFTLVLHAKMETRLSEALRVDSRLTPAEAYDINNTMMDLAIDFGMETAGKSDFKLRQNSPNPFRTQTTINYQLPEAAEVTLTISDATGQTLQVRRAPGLKGNNTLTLQRKDLPAGVLIYTVTTDNFTASRTMVVVE